MKKGAPVLKWERVHDNERHERSEFVDMTLCFVVNLFVLLSFAFWIVHNMKFTLNTRADACVCACAYACVDSRDVWNQASFAAVCRLWIRIECIYVCKQHMYHYDEHRLTIGCFYRYPHTSSPLVHSVCYFGILQRWCTGSSQPGNYSIRIIHLADNWSFV